MSTRVVPIVRPTPHALVPAALPESFGELTAMTRCVLERNALTGQSLRSTNSPLMVVPAALSEFLTTITLGSTFLLIRCTCNNSFTCFNFISSGANVVIVLSFLSIEILSPLKSYRFVISLKQFARALSNSG